MNGYQVKRELMASDTTNRRIIKWWRKENDFADFELLEKFLSHLGLDDEYEGYRLFSTEEMLNELMERAPDRFSLERHNGEARLHWRHTGSDGSMREDVCRYSPQVVMALFERVTRGRTLC